MKYVKSCLIITMLLGVQIAYSQDCNGDTAYNVLDIVILANCVLAQNCLESDFSVWYYCDLNGDNIYNVLDIVALANCVLADNCGG